MNIIRNTRIDQITPIAVVGHAARTLSNEGRRKRLWMLTLVATLGMVLGATSYSGPKTVSNKRVKMTADGSGSLVGSVEIPSPPYSASFELCHDVYGSSYQCVLTENSVDSAGSGSTPEGAVTAAVENSCGSLKSVTAHKLDPLLLSGYINVTYTPAAH
ncbi:MAG: hypothetical protein R3F19_00795 [Verrucomicrobiales bacterium]